MNVKYSLHIRFYSLRTEYHGSPYLGDDPNLGAKVGHVEALYVVSLEFEAAGLQVVEALDQLDDRGLAAAGLSHESHALSRLQNVKRKDDLTFDKITFTKEIKITAKFRITDKFFILKFREYFTVLLPWKFPINFHIK
jgi:hypothetical protein